MIVSVADDIQVNRNDDYIVDIDGLGNPNTRDQVNMPAQSTNTPSTNTPSINTDNEQGISLKGRPWISVTWRCCHTYSRVYRNARGTMYVGRCPKCGKQAQAKVGPNGVDQRFFVAS